ncbi:hypothetical protein D3C80_838640 [compost metagenome]
MKTRIKLRAPLINCQFDFRVLDALVHDGVILVKEQGIRGAVRNRNEGSALIDEAVVRRHQRH